jgi:hypothetical protein
MEAGAPEADESGQAFGERITAVIEPQVCDATSTIINCNILWAVD